MSEAAKQMTCDRCVKQLGSVTMCEDCGRQYARCDACGGAAGAKRSLTAHKGICFMRNERVRKEKQKQR